MGVVGDAALTEFTKRSAGRKVFHFHFPKGGKRLGAENCTSPSPPWEVGAASFCRVVEQGVSAGLQPAPTLSLGAGPRGPVVWRVLFCKSPEPLRLQGASSDCLVLGIETAVE